MTRRPFAAIVLAGDRGPDDPVAHAAGVASKCLVPIAGTPMLLRVLTALAGASAVGARLVCGPSREVLERSPELGRALASDGVVWLAPASTPSRSAEAAVATLPADTPALLTTADHALLRAPIVDYFCARAEASGADVAVGVAEWARVAEAYPATRRTVVRLRDGGYCGCNLFAFLTPAARAALAFWRRVEQERKRPARLVTGVLGWTGLARYALGRLTLGEGLARASRRTGLRVTAVVLPFPEAAVDVDTPDDLRLVRRVAGDAI